MPCHIYFWIVRKREVVHGREAAIGAAGMHRDRALFHVVSARERHVGDSQRIDATPAQFVAAHAIADVAYAEPGICIVDVR